MLVAAPLLQSRAAGRRACGAHSCCMQALGPAITCICFTPTYPLPYPQAASARSVPCAANVHVHRLARARQELSGASPAAAAALLHCRTAALHPVNPCKCMLRLMVAWGAAGGQEVVHLSPRTWRRQLRTQRCAEAAWTPDATRREHAALPHFLTARHTCKQHAVAYKRALEPRLARVKAPSTAHNERPLRRERR